MSNPQEAARNLQIFQDEQARLNQQLAQAVQQNQEIQVMQGHLQSLRQARERQDTLQQQMLQQARQRVEQESMLGGMLQNIASQVVPPVQRQTTPQVSETVVSQVSITDLLLHDSYETLTKQLYGIPVKLPEYLIINGIRSNFVPFQDIANMLSQNQIERYIIDPILQPWAGPPGTTNNILTMFGKNGITYLVKARYNSQTNQIFAPV